MFSMASICFKIRTWRIYKCTTATTKNNSQYIQFFSPGTSNLIPSFFTQTALLMPYVLQEMELFIRTL